MDLVKSIRMAIDTGKVIIGSRETKRSIVHGEGKLVIMANNCPEDVVKDMEYYSNLSNIPILKYAGTSIELGEVCGLPHSISMMVVISEGNSDILSAIKK